VTLLETPLATLLGGRQRNLALALRLAALTLVGGMAVFSGLPAAALWGGLAICLCALWPAYLWSLGHAPGLPIFPVFAATHVWAFGLPVLTAHPGVLAYTPAQIAEASATVCGFLLLGTLAWWLVARRPARAPAAMRAIDPHEGPSLMWVPVAAMAGFQLLVIAGRQELFGPFFSMVRAALLGLNTLAVFLLAMRWGNGQLPARARPALVGLLALQWLAEAATLLLVGPMTGCLIALIGFTAGRGRVPWLAAGGLAAAFVFLHLGKSDMRERYWVYEQRVQLTPAELPGFYLEWTQTSLHVAGDDLLGQLAGRQRESAQPLWWRSSTMQLLLLAQDSTPRLVPFMEGETYRIIPQLLVPRIFHPDKLRTHEGTHRLNVHYGLQRYEDTYATTIGWGLLNEAFANYGRTGVAALAVLLGLAYGGISRWSAPGTLLSLRALFAILVLSYAFQTEFSAGVHLSALFQSAAALGALSLVLMHRRAPPAPAAAPA
jgi:hypothetical protein